MPGCTCDHDVLQLPEHPQVLPAGVRMPCMCTSDVRHVTLNPYGSMITLTTLNGSQLYHESRRRDEKLGVCYAANSEMPRCVMLSESTTL
jgi:hypothetical protein